MKFMSSKAISPMIATVLLIAFTVAVGGILSLWLTGYATTTTGLVETATTNQTKCTGTYISVISVTSDAVLLTNTGSQTVEDIKCYTGNGTILGTLNGSAEDDVSPGRMISTWWNYSFQNLTAGGTTSYVSAYGSLITCVGSCLNTGVTGECKSGQGCWKV